MKIDWCSFGIEQGSSVDSNTIFQVEELLGISFPKSYLDLVTFSDKAAPEISSFSYGNEKTCISEFFSFSPDVASHTILWYSGAGKPLGIPKQMIPIARDAGGYLVCLNFNTSSVAVEIFDPNSSKVNFVANNFSDFVNLWSE
ncbi:SMI1/KNR4 family protein [Pseudomonas anatoliensis]|uniref:SMI1/KNR4 family protein n=1 Tax=Pseudomonas anatoliensis TaxID=2710589 RepID=UPI001B31FE36|nr:SMI1/KNR4 family protein [Pseudomonas anatoliensis]MBP5954591.1 SMI1/KNR4 family protein [Pseudomonas anatoliensis]